MIRRALSAADSISANAAEDESMSPAEDRIQLRDPDPTKKGPPMEARGELRRLAGMPPQRLIRA